MRQQHHANVLPLHCSFVHQQNLWMVMPYVAGGSVLNLMKFAYSEVRCSTQLQSTGPQWQLLLIAQPDSLAVQTTCAKQQHGHAGA